MRAAYIRLGLVLLVVLLTSAAIARNPSCVGDYGNPDRLVINGCKLITPEALKAAVTVNLEILLAADRQDIPAPNLALGIFTRGHALA